MLTDEEIKKVLLYCEFSVRKRKRTLEELQPTYASVLRRKALRVIKDWCTQGVPTRIWNNVKSDPNLVLRFNLKPMEEMQSQFQLDVNASNDNQEIASIIDENSLVEENDDSVDHQSKDTTINEFEENALSGNSAGLIHRDADLMQFVDLYYKNASILPKNLQKRIEAFDVYSITEKAKATLRGEKIVVPELCLEKTPHFNTDINIDEAKLNEDENAPTITPILGRIHSIQSDAKSLDNITFWRLQFSSSVFMLERRGEMVNRTILLRNVNAPARTDADFLTYHVNDYSIDEHLKDPKDVSPFLNVNLPMVSGFVIDPMHTVIEGAFGRRLEGFVFVPAEGKLTSTQIAEANKRIKFFHLCRPYGFDRFVDKLEKCKNYKIHVKLEIVARKFVSLENAHVQPYRSSDHNIFSAHTLSAPTFFRYPSQVFCKMMALPLNPTPPISFENEELRWKLEKTEKAFYRTAASVLITAKERPKDPPAQVHGDLIESAGSHIKMQAVDASRDLEQVRNAQRLAREKNRISHDAQFNAYEVGIDKNFLRKLEYLLSVNMACMDFGYNNDNHCNSFDTASVEVS
ncbi:hypothetical protein OUZ56_030227 [Daphnia magna]|uniref:Uncharacterized protein n=1 Tax=Daphnia magna TaxID=35525 RepID=A0ABQ9ZQP7_9CRUS|nr:hypothetical protein OUZ56_030227 [Daphnia magna]